MTVLRNVYGVGLAMTVALALAALDLDAREGQAAQTPPIKPPNPCKVRIIQRSQTNNGIGVGDARVFDNRTLTLMLESLNESLRNVQFVDAKSLAAALNLLQGFQQESVSRSFSLQSAPLPGITDTLKTTLQAGTTQNDSATGSRNDTSSAGNTSTTNTDARGATTSTSGTTSSSGSTVASGSTSGSGATSSSGQENTRQTTMAARSPVTPELPAVLASPSFAPQFGQSSADLLSDQVNLTYQIFNVRMLLERALTDRLINTEPRLQAVLGFNVTISPPRDTQDSAAFMEVTVTVPGSQEPVSVVAMMPQEKTYNSAALSNRASAFGGSAVAQVFSVGYNERRQSQLFYLFRDNDTVSFDHMDGSTSEKRFGWVFRPVLGRRAVADTPRQMFAVIALPQEDNGEDTAFPVHVKVTTYWRHYDRDTLTTATARTFWQQFARVTSLGSVEDRPPSTESSFTTCVPVPTTEYAQKYLQPKIDALEWQQTGDNTAVITVKGRNFFQGTAVRLGSSRYATAAEGLTLKSDRAFDLTVPLSALVSNGFVDARYGNAINMLYPTLRTATSGLRISSISMRQPGGGALALEILLAARNGAALSSANLPGPPLVALGGTLIPPPYRIETVASQSGAPLLRILAYPPIHQFPNPEGVLTVSVPFAGELWRDTFSIYNPNRVFAVNRFATQANNPTRLLVSSNDAVGNPFAAACDPNDPQRQWAVILGTTYAVTATSAATPGASLISPEFLEIRVPNDDLARHPLLLRDCWGAVYHLKVPAAPVTPPPAVELTKTVPAEVKQHDARKVTIEGANLDRVGSVHANGYKLDSRSTSGGTKLEVFLLGALTEHAGVLTLVCRDDKGAILGSIDIPIR